MKDDVPRHLLDSSALFTLIEDEPGADRVEEAIAAGGTVLSCLALLEVYYVTLQEQGRAEADRRYAWLKELPVEIVWTMDEPTLLIAARLKAGHRLSLADAQIAALAARRGLVLMHKDPEFEAVAGEVRLEGLPYRSAG